LQQTIRYFIRSLQFVWQASKYWTIAKLVLLLIQALLPLASLYLMKLIVDQVSFNLQEANTQDFSEVVWLVIAWGSINLFTTAANTISTYVNENQNILVNHYMAEIIHQKSVSLELAYYENPQYLNTLHRAQAEAKFRPQQILNSLVSLLQNGISLVAIAGLLIYLHWATTVILLFTALPVLLVKLKFSEKKYKWTRSRTQLHRKSFYFSTLLTHAPFAKEMRLFRLGSYLRDKFNQIQHQLFKENQQLAFHQAWTTLLAKALEVMAIVGAYIFIAFRTFAGQLTIGDLVMYYQAFQKGQALLQSAMSGVATIYENKLFLNNLFEFLDLEPAQTEFGHLPIPDLTQNAIKFEEVNFAYTPEGKRILHHINLEAKTNEVISLVGKNGAGKTTLIKLLCKLYEPTEGNIWIGSTNLKDIQVQELRKQISVIFQDFIQYQWNAAENIAIGDIDKEIDLQKVEEAAQLSGASELIEQLPQQYQTTLGKSFVGGEELSVGQWQKIALARAFYSDAQIIVLDEPTSSMDALAEYEFFKRLKMIAQHKIIFLISHRLSSATMSDRIYFIEDGAITESGSHDELIQLNGAYAQLFNKQAQLYREK